MRVEFAESILKIAASDKNLVFVSGDLGFMALEAIRDRLGDRFINAGVAEQNMVSIAAGLAARGFTPLVYSIAPFATLRPFEQIRNDICFHNLPVKIVGNGGGYGYGIMGATHHALEDVGVMRTLPHMRIFVPSFSRDVELCVESMLSHPGPTYLRLGKAAPDYGSVTSASSWSGVRQICQGSSVVVVAMGPVIENIINLLPELPADAVELWTIGEFPVRELPEELISAVQRTGKLLTLEEHYLSGGLAENIAPLLMRRLARPIELVTLHAQGYPSESYGSQGWHQQESGLRGGHLLQSVSELLER